MIEIMESIKNDIESTYEYKYGYSKGRKAITDEMQKFAQWLWDNHYLVDEAFTVRLVEEYQEKNTPNCGDCVRYGDLHSSCDRARYLEANADDKACENYKESKYAKKRQQIKTNLELIREGKHKALNDFMRNAPEDIIEELMSEVPCDKCIAHEYCESLDYFCGTCQEIFGSWLQQSVVVEEEQNE